MEDFYPKWARVLIHYSLGVQPGDHLVIAGDPEAMPLIDACYIEGIESGAICDYLCLCGHHKEILFEKGSDQQLLATPSLWHHAVQTCDKYLIITSSQNTRALAGVPQERHVLYSKGYKPILDTIFKRREAGEISWCLTQFPSPALAQEANMSTRAFAELTARASFLDQPDPIAAWEALKTSQQYLADTLEKGKLLVFENDEGTHLEVDIEGMHWMNHAASSNFPDGEVFTGPNLSAPNGGVNGRVCVTFPTIMKQVEVRGIELTFERGAVVEAKAAENEAFLRAMIDQDAGARYVGEVALGTNYAISSGTKNILFDEKIGGTFHIALGKGYPETGNSNQSALHWDLVTDLRHSGRVFLDGKLISEKGRFLDPQWPSPCLKRS
jgi:aminopeptidase